MPWLELTIVAKLNISEGSEYIIIQFCSKPNTAQLNPLTVLVELIKSPG